MSNRNSYGLFEKTLIAAGALLTLLLLAPYFGLQHSSTGQRNSTMQDDLSDVRPLKSSSLPASSFRPSRISDLPIEEDTERVPPARPASANNFDEIESLLKK